MKIEAIDLFCGIWGATFGFQKAGIKVLAGLDNDNTCKKTFELNNNAKFINADMTNYNFEKLINLYSKKAVKVLVGCAPCQPFSSHIKPKKRIIEDKRRNLINYFLNAIVVVNPEVVAMENVQGLIKKDIFINFKNQIEKLGYQIIYKIVNALDYGVPQKRKRLVFLASKLGSIKIPPKIFNPENYLTVGNTIKGLPAIKSGETSIKDPFHRARNLLPLNLIRIKASKPNGTWNDWPKKLLPNCYRKKTGATYFNVYGRLSWNKPAPTLTTQFTNYGSGRFGHPEQNRALSLREGALLQSFPLNYDFRKDNSFTNIAKHIGNAVPPKLAEAIGKEILTHIQNWKRTIKKA